MSKKIYFVSLISLFFLLTSCTISFSNDQHDEGLSNGGTIEDETIQYYDDYGDLLVTDDYTAHTITISADATEQGADISAENSNQILALMNDPDGVFNTVTTANYVAEGVGGLKVGHLNSSLDGVLDISFNPSFSVSMVEVYAQPRSAVIYSESETVDSIDTPVAVSVNDSKYVRLDTDFSSISTIAETKCSYQLAEAADHLLLDVYGQRAILTKIVVYTLIETPSD
ncbi:MAG: hypothetical protein WC201_02860 [Bacilli bacterium]